MTVPKTSLLPRNLPLHLRDAHQCDLLKTVARKLVEVDQLLPQIRLHQSPCISSRAAGLTCSQEEVSRRQYSSSLAQRPLIFQVSIDDVLLLAPSLMGGAAFLLALRLSSPFVCGAVFPPRLFWVVLRVLVLPECTHRNYMSSHFSAKFVCVSRLVIVVCARCCSLGTSYVRFRKVVR